MDAMIEKKTLRLLRCALDEQQECAISGEYILPEYCPDIASVLKCFAYPRIQSRQWSNQKLYMDGSAVIRLLYVDEGRCRLYTAEFPLNFSAVINCDLDLENVPVTFDLNTKYVNCRVLSPRRVEVRGAIDISVQADSMNEHDVAVASVDNNICCKYKEATYCETIGASEKVISISETLDFPHSHPPAEMLLGGECKALVRECRLLNGKAILKGDIIVHQLYKEAVEGEQIFTLDYCLPFSQILDIPYACEGLPCKVNVQLLSDTERCVGGLSGENTALEVVVKLLIQVQLYHIENVRLLDEAYHYHYPITVRKSPVELVTAFGTRREEKTHSFELPISSMQPTEIIDVSVCPKRYNAVCENNSLRIEGNVTVTLIARDASGEIVCADFPQEFSLDLPSNASHARVDMVITDTNCRVSDDRLIVMARLCISITEMLRVQTDAISSIETNRGDPYPKQKANALLYYATPGESVWDIGRCCRTSPDAILTENSLYDDCIKKSSVIFVPIEN